MLRTGLATLIVSGTLALSACAPGDVELNGKLFDMVGVGSGSASKSRNTQIAERAPLVMPPSMERLPAPETGSTAQMAESGFPIDPEKRGAMSKSELERRQAEYCKVNYQQPLALGDQAKAAGAVGPLGPCAPSVLKAVGSSGNMR